MSFRQAKLVESKETKPKIRLRSPQMGDFFPRPGDFFAGFFDFVVDAGDVAFEIGS